MNIQLRQQPLSKVELERMCLSHLRMLPGSQHIERVAIIGRKGARNWTLLETNPSLSTTAENEARNALIDLQAQFRLVE